MSNQLSEIAKEVVETSFLNADSSLPKAQKAIFFA